MREENDSVYIYFYDALCVYCLSFLGAHISAIPNTAKKNGNSKQILYMEIFLNNVDKTFIKAMPRSCTMYSFRNIFI